MFTFASGNKTDAHCVAGTPVCLAKLDNMQPLHVERVAAQSVGTAQTQEQLSL